MTAIGVIGTGAMGSALVRGWVRSRPPGLRLVVWDKVPALMQRLLGPDQIVAAKSLEDLAAAVETVLVVVKPKDAAEVLGAVAGLLREDQKVVSAMAGVTLGTIRTMVGAGPAVFRIMPNLGVELGVGAVALAAEPAEDEARIAEVLSLFEFLGLARRVPEEMMDAVTAVSGSGPAFLALAIESLEDGAVAAGSSRSLARALVRQTALAEAGLLSLGSGSAAGVREYLAGEGELDQAGVATLEEKGVRKAFRDAVKAAVYRSRGSGGAHVSPR